MAGPTGVVVRFPGRFFILRDALGQVVGAMALYAAAHDASRRHGLFDL